MNKPLPMSDFPVDVTDADDAHRMLEREILSDDPSFADIRSEDIIPLCLKAYRRWNDPRFLALAARHEPDTPEAIGYMRAIPETLQGERALEDIISRNLPDPLWEATLSRITDIGHLHLLRGSLELHAQGGGWIKSESPSAPEKYDRRVRLISQRLGELYRQPPDWISGPVPPVFSAGNR